MTLGDAVIDVIAEPSRGLVADGDVPARIRLVAGGQAANVAAWCASLGHVSTVISAVGSDPAGKLIQALLDDCGVRLAGPRSIGVSGTVLSLVTPDGRRTLLSDRGTSAGLSEVDLEAGWFESCEWLHVSGYCLFDASGGRAALAAGRLASAAGARISTDLASDTLLKTVGADEVRRRVRAIGADVVFANEAEAREAGDLPAPTVVVKRGVAGCRVISDGGHRDVAARPVAVRDTTGAGDAFAAGWLVGGLDLAMRTAETCVSQVGAMPRALH